jgi:16S rRNA (adenine1518-N6/adenine1519-N6)-dimethyltransferase
VVTVYLSSENRQEREGICKIRPLKKFGQNFLVDREIIRKIIDCAKLKREDVVLEIGAGHGELTGLIAENAGKVIAIEMDKKMCRLLNKKFSGFENVEIIGEDVLKLDIRKLISGRKISPAPVHRSWVNPDHAHMSRIKVIGNLPYYITTPILMKLFRDKDLFSQLIIMVQKEVAERMIANPGGKTYGALSVSMCYHTEVEKTIPVSKDSFYPKPKVDSCLISMSIRRCAPVRIADEELFFSFVKGIFGGRRKFLYNAVSRAVSLDKGEMEKLLLNMGINPKVRPENISLKEFADIFESIEKYKTFSLMNQVN